MHKDAMTAVEQSQGRDGCAVWCEATAENIRNLRTWASDARRREGLVCGEWWDAEGLLFRGCDDGMEWAVRVEV
jgi:hypothetical protein